MTLDDKTVIYCPSCRQDEMFEERRFSCSASRDIIRYYECLVCGQKVRPEYVKISKMFKKTERRKRER